MAGRLRHFKAATRPPAALDFSRSQAAAMAMPADPGAARPTSIAAARLRCTMALMRHAHRLRPRTRRRLTWLVVLLLTWHQLALAAYACAMPPATAPTAMAGSASMAMDESCPSMHEGTIQSPVCQAHCHPDHAAQPEARDVCPSGVGHPSVRPSR